MTVTASMNQQQTSTSDQEGLDLSLLDYILVNPEVEPRNKPKDELSLSTYELINTAKQPRWHQLAQTSKAEQNPHQLSPADLVKTPEPVVTPLGITGAAFLLLNACNTGKYADDGCMNTFGDIVFFMGRDDDLADFDGDGYPNEEECLDSIHKDCWNYYPGEVSAYCDLKSEDINPQATENWYDGCDQDCDGEDDFDADGDGYIPEIYYDEDEGTHHTETQLFAKSDWYTTEEYDEIVADVDGDQDLYVDYIYIDDPHKSVDNNSDGDSDDPGEILNWMNIIYKNDISREATDCDDTDPLVNTDASEICDGKDNNCDGEVDEDESIDADIWYADVDEDGFGDPENTALGCSPPTGYIANDDDCDDDDADINPDTVWFSDADGDGYGSVASGTEVECEQPIGYVINKEDCDDDLADDHPGADEYCDGRDNDCDDEIDEDDAVDADDWIIDADGDGYGDENYSTSDITYACSQPYGYTSYADAIDCDDDNADVNPDAAEECNGIDDDCNDYIDGDDPYIDSSATTTWYYDYDGDGYGNSSETEEACSAPSSDYVTDATDCDDEDDAVNPDAAETCDDIDNDCDGDIDDDDSDLDTSSATSWYVDDDGDGYGDEGATEALACSQPTGTIDDNTDCDDGDEEVHPAATEICDEIDNNCDGDIDDDDSSLDTSTAAVWYADSDSDGFGNPDDYTEACEEPAGYIADDEDCDDGDASINPDAVEECDTIDNDCDGDIDDDDDDVDTSTAPTWYEDSDGDGEGVSSSTVEACEQPSGFVSNTDDCDDSDDAIYTSATEVCDEVDNDCDGAIDDADSDVDTTTGSTWYADDDSDGFGNPDDYIEACEETYGYSANDEDCDDGDAAINPDAVEECDEFDNDCDGAIDDDDDDLDTTTGSTWYADSDGDGEGTATSTKEACDEPFGFVANTDDCDDSDDAINTSATEICDSIDNDCDGDADDADSSLDSSTTSTWYADSDSDGYGDADVTEEACAQPSDFVDNAQDCDDTEKTINPAASEAFNGEDDDCDGETDNDISVNNDGEILTGASASDLAGSSLAAAGDLDTDGYDDLLVGATGENGTAYQCYGPITTSGSLSDNCVALTGENYGDAAGISVAGVGDVDGDGSPDSVVGAFRYGGTAGAAYLVSGAVTVDMSLSSAAGIHMGEGSGDYAGVSVSAAGDNNSDGYSDFLVGAYLAESGAGLTYLVHGPATGTNDLGDAAATFYGEAAGDQSGSNVIGNTDIDGDGFGDFIISGYQEGTGGTAAGAAYVYFGPATGNIDLADAAVKLYGESAGDESGSFGDQPLDIDGDGYDDILCRAPDEDTTANDAGAAYVILGTTINTNVSSGGGSWSSDLSAADIKILGEAEDDGAGISAGQVTDMTSDGGSEIVIGARFNEEGYAYLLFSDTLSTGGTFYLSSDADAKWIGSSSGSSLGTRAVGVGDVNGDGLGDIGLGATRDDSADTDAGAVYIYDAY
jgi:hypothetical protein